MREQRAVKVGPGVEFRATLEDGKLKYMEVVAKKSQLKPEEVDQLSSWLLALLHPEGFNKFEGPQKAKIHLDEELYDGGTVPLEDRSAANPPPFVSGLQVMDMSDKLPPEAKVSVKFSVPKGD